MKIILSPAKTMTQEKNSFNCTGVPVLLEHSNTILSVLREKNLSELKDIWKCRLFVKWCW